MYTINSKTITKRTLQNSQKNKIIASKKPTMPIKCNHKK